MLLEHVGEILSRDEITNLVWHRRVIGRNVLPNAIHTLRIALGDENKQQLFRQFPKWVIYWIRNFALLKTVKINLTKKITRFKKVTLLTV